MPEPKKFWFPAKRYGWGWGFPVTWQGWLVLVGFLVLLDVGTYAFPPGRRLFLFVGYMVAIISALAGVLRAKSEPGAWRWGRK
jgi:hypothetical protein